jgi:Tol biopolymer transport system component
MCDVTRRVLLVGMALACLASDACPASADVPEGPRLALVRFSERPAALELLTGDESGLELQKLAGGSIRVRPLPLFLDAPSWSPDGSLIAFSAWPGKIARRRLTTEVFVVGADGSGLRAVPGTSGGIGPVFAPDGHTIAFVRKRKRRRRTHGGGERTIYTSETTWLADLNGAGARRISPWRNGLDVVPTSFSPDGSVLLLARQGGQRLSELVAMRLDGSGATVLTRDATDGVYSPDGSQIAFSRVRAFTRRRHGSITSGTTGDLFVMKADGSEPRRLTSTPTRLEIWPSWDPSGQRLAYVQLRLLSLAGFLGFGDSVMEANADGTCSRTILASRQLAFYGAAWQPGVSRGAGRLAC